MEREFLVPITSGYDKAAKLGRGGVVGMPFEFGAEPENLGPLERPVDQRVQGVEDAEADGDAAAEAARARHFTGNGAGKSERFGARRAEKSARRLLRHRPGLETLGAGDGDEIIDLQGNAEAVEARAEIRSGGRNAHRDLLLFQRKPPENTGERLMAALTLTREVAAARSGPCER